MDRREFLRLAGIGAVALGTRSVSLAANLPFKGQDTFDRIMSRARKEGWANLALGDRVGAVGMALVGTPYVGNTLERVPEVCSVDLTGLDCVTLFETSLAFAHMIGRGGSTPADLIREVARTRYRDGKVGDYSSRLHYTVDWFFDNDRRKNVRDITSRIPGAAKLDKKIDFMSTHPTSYKQLADDPAMVARVRGFEDAINKRAFWHVPKDAVPMVESLLETGDIVGITTSIEGLDCTHTGLCYRDGDGALRFLHASSAKKQVILGPRLSTYLDSIPKDIGIMIAKPG